jgi:hypothetical protein
MELAIIALGAAAIVVQAARHTSRPKAASPVDPYTAWMMTNLPRLRSWRR